MESTAVHLDRPPHSARLLAWGRTQHGVWWGLCGWRQRIVTAAGQSDELAIAAWVPATSISKPDWSSPVAIARVELGSDQRSWPAPDGWPSWYAGPWANDELRLPPGVAVDRRPEWERRRDRGESVERKRRRAP